MIATKLFIFVAIFLMIFSISTVSAQTTYNLVVQTNNMRIATITINGINGLDYNYTMSTNSIFLTNLTEGWYLLTLSQYSTDGSQFLRWEDTGLYSNPRQFYLNQSSIFTAIYSPNVSITPLPIVESTITPTPEPTVISTQIEIPIIFVILAVVAVIFVLFSEKKR
jgi:hypothetical protein